MPWLVTGNSFNMRHPHSLQLIMDSLRCWVVEMRVDGFRFDLAATLARELHEVHMLSSFFHIIQQDPVISQVKLIAEPWDLGEGGYQVGNFPPLWSEWNGRYRDTLRDFWRGVPHAFQEFADCFTGSGDLYQGDTRRPTASVNFVTAHDGFTLLDLVSYQRKRNEANGEGGRDGDDHNRSWNCGVEGPSEDPAVRDCRDRQRRNFLATLFLSQGVPMLLGGDEMGRTQGGNNNAYCQDNETSWLDWGACDSGMLDFTRRLIHFQREHPVFRRRRWFQEQPIRGTEDIVWLRRDGEEMSEHDWTSGEPLELGVFLNGNAIPSPGKRGERIVDDRFLVLFNARHEDLEWQVPSARFGRRWRVVVDSATGFVGDEGGAEVDADVPLPVEGRSVVVLLREDEG
jgi:isoamylase